MFYDIFIPGVETPGYCQASLRDALARSDKARCERLFNAAHF